VRPYSLAEGRVAVSGFGWGSQAVASARLASHSEYRACWHALPGRRKRALGRGELQLPLGFASWSVSHFDS